MNLVADEGVDRPVVERLRQDGHHVVCVAEMSPSAPDEEVLQQANAGSAVLLTADKDFGELVFRQGLVHSGVVLPRLAGLANALAEPMPPVEVQCLYPAPWRFPRFLGLRWEKVV